VAQEPRTAQERALELLRATLAISSWLPTAEAKRLVWVIRCAIALGLLVLIASVVDKTLWDWLGLLIVPVVLAIGGYLFNSSQNRATQAAAERRAQDESLQAYLQQVGKLLLDKDRPLRQTQARDEARTLARARTIAVLRTLDRNHNRILLNFLQEAGLLRVDDPVINLKNADLSQIDLGDVIISRAMLSEVNLRKANLRGAELIDGTDLSESHLEEADLRGAILDFDLGLSAGARYFQQSGSAWTVIPDDPTHATHLIGTNLKKANLHNAKLTNKQLAECASLEGATMPDGQKYEDWLGTPQGLDWIRKYKKNLGADKKRAGVYEDWIKTPEGGKWLQAVGEDGETSGPP
jgi:hypothetical protein